MSRRTAQKSVRYAGQLVVPEPHDAVRRHLLFYDSQWQFTAPNFARFRSSQSTTMLLSVWSASKGCRKGGGCHESNDHSRGNGCALSGDSVHVQTMDSSETGEHLCQYISSKAVSVR